MVFLKKTFSLLKFKPLLTSQASSIVSRKVLDQYGPRPKPYPYDEMRYTNLQQYLDKTTYRFDENTKIIVVDGPVASGKTELAKAIAEEFDMQYIPHANLDSFYVSHYGVDVRQLNHFLPLNAQSFDIEEFLRDPFDNRAAFMQYILMEIRFSDYLYGLVHLMSTGQGIVLNRSIFSDFVFLEAMYKLGCVKKAFREHYYNVKYQFIQEILRPHLIIYLDVPVDVTMQNIKERDRPFEKDSPFLKPEILQYMGDVYKKQYLKTMTKHSEMLAYDWSIKGDFDDVFHDIEETNLDNYDFDDEKMSDWRQNDETQWCMLRAKFSRRDNMMELSNIAPEPIDCPELYREGGASILFSKLLEKLRGGKHAVGYNPDCGDEKVLFKFGNRDFAQGFSKNF